MNIIFPLKTQLLSPILFCAQVFCTWFVFPVFAVCFVMLQLCLQTGKCVSQFICVLSMCMFNIDNNEFPQVMSLWR